MVGFKRNYAFWIPFAICKYDLAQSLCTTFTILLPFSKVKKGILVDKFASFHFIKSVFT